MSDQPTKPRSFIHSELDELRLSAVQFRIYCHILRRGELFAIVDSTAEACCMDDDTVWKALRELESFRMIRRIKRHGTTSLFIPTDQSEWNLEAIKNRPRRKKKDGVAGLTGRPADSADPAGNSRAGDGRISGPPPGWFN